MVGYTLTRWSLVWQARTRRGARRRNSFPPPASAKLEPMPRSVIDAGLADVVAPVEELPGKIVAYLRPAAAW